MHSTTYILHAARFSSTSYYVARIQKVSIEVVCHAIITSLELNRLSGYTLVTWVEDSINLLQTGNYHGASIQ